MLTGHCWCFYSKGLGYFDDSGIVSPQGYYAMVKGHETNTQKSVLSKGIIIRLASFANNNAISTECKTLNGEQRLIGE